MWSVTRARVDADVRLRPFGDSCIVELREPKTARDGVAALACVQAVHGRNSRIRPGSDITFGWRGAEGKKELYPQILTESVEQQVDVILSGPVPAAVVAKQVTTTVPIVFIVVANPVTLGLLKNLEKRGGNTPASTKNGPISRASA